MSSDWLTIAWLVLGVVLIGSELFLPSLLSLFVGAGALVVALARFLGLVEGLPASVGVWIVSSVVMVLTLRKALLKFVPTGASRANVDERSSEFGVEVDVTEDICDDDDTGRIRFQGTTWKATTTGPRIPKGKRARIVFRDNLVYVVEAVEPALLESGTTSPVPSRVDVDKAS